MAREVGNITIQDFGISYTIFYGEMVCDARPWISDTFEGCEEFTAKENADDLIERMGVDVTDEEREAIENMFYWHSSDYFSK